VAPITLGTGQQNKVLEAIASGCEVVCSADVSDGLPGLRDFISIAKTAEEYAELILKKWTDYPKNESQRNLAKAFVKENFSWEKNTAPLLELLKKPKCNYLIILYEIIINNRCPRVVFPIRCINHYICSLMEPITPSLHSIEDALEDIRQGKVLIVVGQ
jgi:hypothetical protein